MSLKEEYIEILKDLKEATEELKPIARKYHKLQGKISELEKEKYKLYQKLKYEEYDNCKHLTIVNYIDHTPRFIGDEGYTEEYHGCVKCGLNEDYKHSKWEWVPYYDYHFPYEKYTTDKALMKSYFKDRLYNLPGSSIVCDLDLGMEVYKRLKESNPDAVEEEIDRLFKMELQDMSEKEGSKVRIINRQTKSDLELEIEDYEWSKILAKHM